MNSYRLNRVSSLIEETIGTLISRQEIKDPRISSLLSVSDIEISRDLQFAKVGISGYVSAKELEEAVDALNNASGFVQSRLGKAMKTRLTPRLTFFINNRVEEAFKLTKKIEELVRDAKSGDSQSSET